MKVHDLFENDDWEVNGPTSIDRDKRAAGLDHELDILIETIKNMLRKKIIMSDPTDQIGQWWPFIIPKGIVNADSIEYTYCAEPGEKGEKRKQYMDNFLEKLNYVWNQYKMLKHGVSYDDESM